MFFIVSLESSSQQKIWTGDTTYWYAYQKKILTNVKLDNLSKSENLYSFRISTTNTILDIWTEDGIKYLGRQTFFTSTIDENPKKIEYIFKTETITEDTANLIYQLIIDYNIQTLPIQDSIKGWRNGFDGEIYLIEFSNVKSYSFKSYTSLQKNFSLPEADNLKNFILKIEQILMQKQKLDSFIFSLPTNKSYRYGNALTKINTKSKSKRKN